MKRRFLVSFALFSAALPLFAQGPGELYARQLELLECGEMNGALSDRAAAFSALGGLPADTESFLALGRPAEILDYVAPEDSFAQYMALELVRGVDSVALGASRASIKDLTRLAPLLELLEQSQPTWCESWMRQAEPAAARAIVAQQREDTAAAAEQLVQYTRDFHLSPIYLVVTCKPGMQMLLHQASMLPLMIPVEPGGPVELTAQGAWRGFCIKGNMVDLRQMDLSPEQESRLRENLEKLQVYVMARVVDNKLVLVITSDMSKVKHPASVSQSVLRSDKLAILDPVLSKNPLLVGYTAPELVNLSSRMDMVRYRSVARFLANVFRRYGKESAVCARAASAVDVLTETLEKLAPASQQAEQCVVWSEDALYMRFVKDAGHLHFLPGTLSQLAFNVPEKSILYAETTPVESTGPELPSFPVLLEECAHALQGCKATLKPEEARGVEQRLSQLEQARPALETVASGVSKLASGASGSVALLVQESAAACAEPVQFSLRAGMTGAEAALETGTLLAKGSQMLSQLPGSIVSPLVMQNNEQTLTLGSEIGGMEPGASAAGHPVQGGAVFSMQFGPLNQALERAGVQSKDTQLLNAASFTRAGAAFIERLEGAAVIRDGQLHILMRALPSSK